MAAEPLRYLDMGVPSRWTDCSPAEDHISVIPPELLSTILRLAQYSAEPEDESERRPNIPVEVVASHVSLYWREVALTTRLLWRHIDVCQIQPEKLHVYLTRSGDAPLHLQFDLIQRPREVAVLAQKIDLVFMHLHRWGRLTIHSNIETSGIPVVSRLYDVPAPALQHLTLCIDDVDSENLKSIRRADFEQILTKGCPRLSVLRLRGVSMHFFRPPLTNITTLYLEQTRGLFIGYKRFKHLLTASPALAHLSIHDAIIDEWEETWPPDSCIPLPSLLSLRISFPGTLQHVFSDLLLSISAPRLHSLVLKDVGEVHLHKFCTHPDAALKFPALRALTFTDFEYGSAERLVMTCAAFPGITEFTSLQTSACVPKILRLMARHLTVSVAGSEAPAEDPWPRLDTLNMTLDVEDLETIQAVVERRKSIGCPLRTLRVSASVFEELQDEDDETLEWLEDNVAIEPFVVSDGWPPGSDYDPDDELFW